MKKVLCHLAFILIFTGLSVPVAYSQVIAQTQSSTTKTAGDRLVNIHVRNEALGAVINDIVAQARLQLSYSPAILPAGREVTVNLVDVPAKQALETVLRGSGLELRVVTDGQLTLVRASSVRKNGQGIISGKILDAKSGKGIAGASVSVGNDTRGVLSSEDGAYRLAGIPAGVHTISVRLVGYAKQTKQVTVDDNAAVVADFKLAPSASVLDQVVVTGTVVSTELKAVPNAITVITAKQIEERGITRIDQLFRGDVPGLFAINQGSNAALDEVVMFSRGATALSTTSLGTGVPSTTPLTNSIKTYVDGVEMVDSRYLSQIDPRSIERIEILTGPQASTIYGSNALNGVMQIFTKRGANPRPKLTLDIQSSLSQNNFNDHLAPGHAVNSSISGLEGLMSYNIGGSWNYIGAWTPSKQTQRLGAYGSIRMNTSKFSADVGFRHGLTKNKQNGSQIQSAIYSGEKGIWIYRLSDILDSKFTSSLTGETVGLTLGYQPASWWSHEIVIGKDQTINESIDNPTYVFNDTLITIKKTIQSRTSERYTTTVQAPVSTAANLNLTLGADHWLTPGNVWSRSALALTGTFPGLSVTRNRTIKNDGVFLQSQLSLNDAIFLTYGLRAEWNPGFGAKTQPNFAPRYGISYTRELGSISAKLRGSYGRSTRPPNLTQKQSLVISPISPAFPVFGLYFFQLANDQMLPEHQQGGEGGLELYFGNRGSLNVTRYNQTVDNLISNVSGVDSVRSLAPSNSSQCSSTYRDPDGYCFKYNNQNLNVGGIRNQGWEVQGSINTGPITTRGTYSWTKSRVLGITPAYRGLLTGSQFQPGRPFDFLPEHTWSLGMTYARSTSMISLYVNGLGMLYRQLGLGEESILMSANNRFTNTQIRMDIPNGYRGIAPGYTTADLNATHRLTDQIDVLLQVQNLTNYYQNDFSAFNVSLGRQTKLGLRLLPRIP